MSERKVLNKYYPPDFDPAKIPRMKLSKNRQYTVRLMAPFNMRCVTCGEYIYKGKKFNARKEDAENETYLGIRIYRFYIKCTRCLQEISFKTDPKNTDYEIEAGATRNFMALKLAEEQAQREHDELKEEEANNPMKLLEKRTQQSRNEIDMLESLEELRDLNRRQQTVDYAKMLQQFHPAETDEERELRLQREDEEYIKTVKFRGVSSSGGLKRIVAEEVIEDVHPDDCESSVTRSSKLVKLDAAAGSSTTLGSSSTSTGNFIGGFTKTKSLMKNLVQKNSTSIAAKPVIPTTPVTAVNNSLPTPTSSTEVEAPAKPLGGALSMLANYSDSSEDE